MIVSGKRLGVVLIMLSLILLGGLVFIKTDFDALSAFTCQAVSETADLSMGACPAHSGNASWFILFGFIDSFLILLIGVYLVMAKPVPNEVKREFKKIDLSSLNEEERKIYNLVKAKDGSMYQSALVKEMGFSKVKMTRVLDGLESKGVLERKRRGMTNLVVLK
ncbi:MAG: hypothetical protein GOV15_00780 [Candidatus Diapherotrites archaeon]|nr:hypothetical protein [Candidatus Diapherotrites archaeon]